MRPCTLLLTWLASTTTTSCPPKTPLLTLTLMLMATRSLSSLRPQPPRVSQGSIHKASLTSSACLTLYPFGMPHQRLWLYNVRSIRWALTIVSNVQVVVEMLGYKIGGAGTKWKWVRLSPPLLHARVLPL